PSMTGRSRRTGAKHLLFFFSSRRRHTRSKRDWSSDVCSSDLRHERVMTAASGTASMIVCRSSSSAVRTKSEKMNIQYPERGLVADRKSTRLNSSHVSISYAVFCLKKKKK